MILAANKAEGRAGEAGALEAYALGLGEPLRISAEHGEGLDDLYRVLEPLAEGFAARNKLQVPDTDVDVSGDEGEDEGPRKPTREKPLQLAVIGRPNAGKSTLINKIIGEDRLLTGPEAGITRDAISVSADFMGTPMRIFDTAGMRKRAKVTDKLEKLSVADGLRAVRFAEVVVVLLDVDIPFEQQDLRIADFAETEGRAVVVAANKWDLKRTRPKAEGTARGLRTAPAAAQGRAARHREAKTGKGLDRLHAAILKAYERLGSPRHHREAEPVAQRHDRGAPAPRAGRPPDPSTHMTQVKTRPPAFVVMCTHADQLPESYGRYLTNGLREGFDIPNPPIRLTFRDQGKEPLQGQEEVHPVAAQEARPKRARPAAGLTSFSFGRGPDARGGRSCALGSGHRWAPGLAPAAPVTPARPRPSAASCRQDTAPARQAS